MREIQKIRTALSVLSIGVASLASVAVVAATSAPALDLQARSAEELAKWVAGGGAVVTC